jgi:hypothetical protein
MNAPLRGGPQGPQGELAKQLGDAAPVGGVTLADVRLLVRDELAALLAERAAPRLLTTDELADFLQVSSRTIRSLRAEGLPVFLIGDAPRFELPAVLTWLRARRSP